MYIQIINTVVFFQSYTHQTYTKIQNKKHFNRKTENTEFAGILLKKIDV